MRRQIVTGRIDGCSTSSRTPPGSRAAPSRSAVWPRRRSRSCTARPSSSTASRRCGGRRGRSKAALGGGHVAYGTKAFPNVALLRLLREEGIGADVASAGELAFARAAGLSGDELVVHGNNKDAAFLSQVAADGATVVLDAPDEAELAAAAGVRRALVRVTLGVDADTHEAIRTGHHGSKFGLPPDQAHALVASALERGIDVLGLHVHVGSQLADFDAQAETIVRLASFAARCRKTLGVDAAGRRPRRRLRHPAPPGRARRAGRRPGRVGRRVPHGRRSPSRACRTRRSGSSRGARWSAGPV